LKRRSRYAVSDERQCLGELSLSYMHYGRGEHKHHPYSPMPCSIGSGLIELTGESMRRRAHRAAASGDKYDPTSFSAAAEARSCRQPTEHAAACTDFRWHGIPAEMLVAISARLHRHPVPMRFLSLAVEESARHQNADPIADEGVVANGPAD